MLPRTHMRSRTYKVSEIVWDTDGQECDMPTECLIDVMVNCYTTEGEIEESISNAITDIGTFCHKGFAYEVNQ